MTLTEIAKRIEKLAADNSPAILTAIGVTGTLTTAYLAGRASFKAAEIIREREEEDGHAVDPRIRLKHRTILTWKLYLPAAGTAVLTVTAIISANRIGSRRTAAMAAAYSLTEKAFEEYRQKIREKFGENKEREARDELAQDRVNENPVSSREVIITSGGEVLCYDQHSGRYFQSDMETLKKAQNDTNYQVLNDFYASLGDFYHRIGLPATSYSEEVGWNSDKMMELQFSTTLSEDGRPCLAIDFAVAPVRDYCRVN